MKFVQFLESLKTSDNTLLIESITEAYSLIEAFGWERNVADSFHLHKESKTPMDKFNRAYTIIQNKAEQYGDDATIHTIDKIVKLVKANQIDSAIQIASTLDERYSPEFLVFPLKQLAI